MTQELALDLRHPLGFDIVSQPFKADPFPTLAAMRDAGPVLPMRLPFVGRVWLATTHASCLAMVKDNEIFVQEGRHAGRSGVPGFAWWLPKPLKVMTNNMLQKDEPDHRRLRHLVDKAFARRDVLAMRGGIERIADELIDGFQAQPAVDLVEAYARQLPMAVICDLLGLSDEDRIEFSAQAMKVLNITSSLSLLMTAGAFNRMLDQVRRLIETARHAPRPGLIAELVAAEEAGDRLNAAELLSMIVLLLVAGFETTRQLIADSVILLENHPDQKAWLLADPAERMERAVEELARYASPVQMTKPRYVSRDTDFFGVSLKRGEIIMALLAGANSDPEVFDAPEALRLDRFPNPHLVFSSGVHFCLGMQLARVEAQSAIGRLYARCPDLRLADPSRIEWIGRLGIRGPKALPVILKPRAARLAA